MKLIESKEELQSWENYQECMQAHLRLLAGAGEPFFVSREKIAFEFAGKPWNGFAVLVGPKGTMSARKLQKEGVLFREGTCGREGKELRVDGLEARLLKEASRTIKKLLLGYKIAGAEEDGGSPEAADAAGDESAAPEARRKKFDDLRKLASDLDRLLAALDR